MSKLNNRMNGLSARSCGVLLHVSSLPGPHGIGDLGPEAHRWIDLLARAGQRWWQMLPLGSTGESNSPYRCYSAFAGNPLLISLDLLVEDGLLTRGGLRGVLLPGGKVDYLKVRQVKVGLLTIAFDRFKQQQMHRLAGGYQRFVTQEAHWLDDFALFMALRESNPSEPWYSWPKPILLRAPGALRKVRHELADAVEFHRFTQFIFSRQLQSLREHARRAGVGLIGDLPIFVSPESADVWTNPKLFELDRNLQPRCVAGVPPDMFAKTGQRWGNPLYNWKAMAKDNFRWWRARLKSALSQADLVRIDHFRGFEAYWRIPADCATAERGRWVKAPGEKLFRSLFGNSRELPLVAEDLGIITPEVEQLRDRFNLPGMRVLQFGFGSGPDNLHLPHNYVDHCIAYTGTHDNETTVGWYKALPAAGKRQVQEYAPHLNWKTDPSWSLIHLLVASVARWVIVPLQDLLALDNRSRMNTPGLSLGNWEWRLDDFSSCQSPLHRLDRLGQIYGRQPPS